MGTLKKSLLSAYGGYAFRTLYLLVLIPLYARTLGPDAYGLVIAAMAIQNLVWTIQNWGFSFTGARNMAATTTGPQRQQEFSSQLTARLLITPLAILAGLGAVLGSPLLSGQPLLAGLAVACGVLSGYNLGWYFQGRLNFTTPILIEGAGCMLTLTMVLLLVHGPADVHWVMVSLLVPGTLTSVLAYVLAGREVRPNPAPVREGLRTIAQCSHLFIAGGASALMAIVGTYALSAVSTPDQVAHYGTAEKVVVTLLGLLGPVGQVMLSWFTRQLNDASGHGTAAVVAKQFKAVRTVTLCGAAAMLAAATILPTLLSLWLGPQYAAVGSLMRLLSPLLLICAFNSAVAIYVLVPHGRERLISRLSAATAVLGVGAAYLGAWTAGAEGVAIARLGTELVTCIAFLLILRLGRSPLGRPALATVAATERPAA